jgi:hypothetical protein
MTANDIRELTRAQPFRPFTVHMDDGLAYRIQHPDGILLGNFVAMVAEPSNGAGDHFTRLSIRHIVKLEESPSVERGA